MNLEHLKTYIELAKTGNFSEVAKKLSISQPAVSFQIQKLEQDLGVRLIDRRQQKKPALTEAGKRLLRFAETVQGQYDELLTEFSRMREEVEGNLVITASTIPGDFILPSLLSEFKSLHPAVQASVAVSDSGRVIDNIKNGAFDIGFCGVAPEDSDLETVKIAEDEIVLIVFPGHPFDGRKSVSLMEVAGESVIFRGESSGTQRSLTMALSKSGFDINDFKPELILGSTEAVVSAVEARLGIAFVSDYAIKKSLSLGLVKVVGIEGLTLKRDFFCIYRKQRVVSRLLEEFIDFVRRRAA